MSTDDKSGAWLTRIGLCSADFDVHRAVDQHRADSDQRRNRHAGYRHPIARTGDSCCNRHVAVRLSSRTECALGNNSPVENPYFRRQIPCRSRRSRRSLFLMSSMPPLAYLRMLRRPRHDPKLIVCAQLLPSIRLSMPMQVASQTAAANPIPIDCRLLRASVDHRFVQTLFPAALIEDPTIEVAVCKVSEEQGTALNSALRSNFQFFGSERLVLGQDR